MLEPRRVIAQIGRLGGPDFVFYKTPMMPAQPAKEVPCPYRIEKNGVIIAAFQEEKHATLFFSLLGEEAKIEGPMESLPDGRNTVA